MKGSLLLGGEGEGAVPAEAARLGGLVLVVVEGEGEEEEVVVEVVLVVGGILF